MIRVRIPATTANLGPGFDCMGLALDLWNSFEMRLVGEGIRVSVDGEGEGVLARQVASRECAVMLVLACESWLTLDLFSSCNHLQTSTSPLPKTVSRRLNERNSL